MCIGIPMRITANEPGHAWCEGMGERKRVDTLLIGEQPIGTWILVSINSAREILSEEDAINITQAVQAVNLAMRGEDHVEHLFSDLINREPQLPDFLKPKSTKPKNN